MEIRSGWVDQREKKRNTLMSTEKDKEGRMRRRAEKEGGAGEGRKRPESYRGGRRKTRSYEKMDGGGRKMKEVREERRKPERDGGCRRWTEEA